MTWDDLCKGSITIRNDDGTVALDEFLRLERSCGLSRERLGQLFRERDADCSDDLTLDEFRALATEYRPFDHKQAIVHLGLEAKQEREIEQRFAKENLWKLGLPLEKLTPAQPHGNRPSLTNIGEFIVSSSSCALIAGSVRRLSRIDETERSLSCCRIGISSANCC